MPDAPVAEFEYVHDPQVPSEPRLDQENRPSTLSPFGSLIVARSTGVLSFTHGRSAGALHPDVVGDVVRKLVGFRGGWLNVTDNFASYRYRFQPSVIDDSLAARNPKYNEFELSAAHCAADLTLNSIHRSFPHAGLCATDLDVISRDEPQPDLLFHVDEELIELIR
ncbi:MAG TPA: hypothetical protein VFZ37_12285 [Jiangellaceae bacterium]